MIQRDFVQLQETTNLQLPSNILDGKPIQLRGKLIGQLQLVFTIQDPISLPNYRGPSNSYIGALINLYQPIQGGVIDEVYGIVEIRKQPIVKLQRQQKLSKRRIYIILIIIQSTYIVLTGNGVNIFVNPQGNQDYFNYIYDKDFKEKSR